MSQRFFISGFAAVLSILFLISPSLAIGQSVPAAEIRPGLYVMTWAEGPGNVAFLVTDEGVIVVDSGESVSRGKEIMSQIRKITDKPIQYVILTQYHDDHTEGLPAFPETAAVIGHARLARNRQAAAEYNLAVLAKRREDLRAKIAALPKGSPDLAKAEERLKATEKTEGDLRLQKPLPLARTFDQALTLHSGKDTVIVHYPGNTHTSCSSVVHFVRQNAVHLGDMLFVGTHPYIDGFAEADTRNWISALNAIRKWNVDIFIPGHGKVSGLAALEDQKRYLEDLRTEVAASRAEGLTLEQTKKAVTLAGYKEYGWPDLLPLNIEAVYKELGQIK